MKYLVAASVVLAALAAPLRAQDIPLSKILVDKEGWRQVAAGLKDISHLEGMPGGSVAVNLNGAPGTLGLDGKFMAGPDVYLLRNAHSVMVGKKNYAIDREGKSLNCFEGGKRIDMLKLPGLKTPSCVAVWPDDGHLVIGESDGAYLWAVRIEKDGKFGPGDRYYSLRTRAGEKMSVSAMTMDASFLLYACTPIGIQVFDPTGRLSGVIAAPAKEPMTAITIGGAKADELYVGAGDRIFARKIQFKAAYTLKKKVTSDE
ncbi:MAG TPA: SMP-30/gluconolactonase/LRE family protein [Gemmataceae bacterium]|nr:SMP-30/gluconolactonase/LRE family protein [Gemmataceae bacterium]